MNGWYIVYILLCVINGFALAQGMGDPFRKPSFYICVLCIVGAFIAGTKIK